jgi:hypothetical protein
MEKYYTLIGWKSLKDYGRLKSLGLQAWVLSFVSMTHAKTWILEYGTNCFGF